ncbi:DUF432 domain-containing protein [Thermococcus sp.]|uniref:DUF432 domain-containing protein n=1 Tax=Thermococcus sp. TaxID=35749 RepID=UPI0026207EAB|nr:DUF432 domain-containing protein [Thermococcus sp.]
MFGEYKLRTQFIKIGDVKIHIVDEGGGLFRYRREDVSVLLKGPGKGLEIVPAPAEGYGVKILLIDFEDRILIPPKEEVGFYLSAPVEAEVRLGETVIDRFQLSKEKYALYGTPEVGAIARYWKSRVYPSEPESACVLKASVTNGTTEWVEMDHVVVYIRGSVMFHNGKRAYYPLILIEFKSGVPEVNNTGKPPKDGLKPSREPLPLPNFIMRW